MKIHRRGRVLLTGVGLAAVLWLAAGRGEAVSLLQEQRSVFPIYPIEPNANTAAAKTGGISGLPFPFAAYIDTYGLLGGAGMSFFDQASQTRLTTSYLTNFNGYDRYRLRFDWRHSDWIFDITGSVGNDIEDYFGEGDNTPASFQQYLSALDTVTISFQYLAQKNLYVGPSLQYLYRFWFGGGPSLPASFGTESEWRTGLTALWDGRDNVLEPHQGFYDQWGLFTLPSSGESGFGAGVWQLEGDMRAYTTVLGNVVLAGRVNGAWTAGDPSYSFVYSLGGNNELRGYHTNRFRGTRFYGLQGEARIPLFPWLNGSTALDVGDITDNAFSVPLASFQLGLRSDVLEAVGLILRLDWGIGKDENEFTFSSSEPF